MRYNSLCSFLPFFIKQQHEIAKFCIFLSRIQRCLTNSDESSHFGHRFVRLFALQSFVYTFLCRSFSCYFLCVGHPSLTLSYSYWSFEMYQSIARLPEIKISKKTFPHRRRFSFALKRNETKHKRNINWSSTKKNLRKNWVPHLKITLQGLSGGFPLLPWLSLKLEYEVNILTLSYTLFNTRGTETKTVGLKENKHEKAINIKNNFKFVGKVFILHEAQTYLRASRSSRMFRGLPPKNPTLPP